MAFRKLLFDGEGTYIRDFHVTGRLRLRGATLRAEWHRITIETTSGDILDIGTATSEGTRIE